MRSNAPFLRPTAFPPPSPPPMLPGFVRGFLGTMQSSDSSCLPARLRSVELPRLARDRVAAAGDMRPPRFRTKDFSTRMGSQTAQGPSHTRPSSHETMLPSPQRKKIGTLEKPVSQLNTQLMVSPVNASRQPSRTAAHHSGPERLARPYSAVDFHLLSFASLSWRTPLMATSRSSSPLVLRPELDEHRTLGCPLCLLSWFDRADPAAP